MMQVIMDMRPYPEQTPPITKERYFCLARYEGRLHVVPIRWHGSHSLWRSYGITHFCLPEDIHTEESK